MKNGKLLIHSFNRKKGVRHVWQFSIKIRWWDAPVTLWNLGIATTQCAVLEKVFNYWINLDYWINIKLLNEFRTIEQTLSYWVNTELLNKYKFIE